MTDPHADLHTRPRHFILQIIDKDIRDAGDS